MRVNASTQVRRNFSRVLGLAALSAVAAHAQWLMNYAYVSGTPQGTVTGFAETYSPLGSYVAADVWMTINGGSGGYVSGQPGYGMSSAQISSALPPTGGANVEVHGYHFYYVSGEGSQWIHDGTTYAQWGYADPNNPGGPGGDPSQCIPNIQAIVPNSGPGSGYIEAWGSNLSDLTELYVDNGASSGNLILVSDEQVNISFSGLANGQHTFTVANSCGGSNAVSYTVQPDPTPTITSITPDIWEAGGQYDVVIQGAGFGTDPAVTFNSPYVHWVRQGANDVYINGAVSVDEEAPSGEVEVTVTSNGYWGNGFQGQGNPPAGQPRRVQVVAGNQTLSLVVRANGNPINQGQTIYITSTPAMPSITARWETANGQPAQAGTATYRLTISYDGHNHPFSISFPSGAAQSVPAGQSWSPPGLGFYGGEASLAWSYQGSSGTFQFKIRGQNPSDQQVRNLLSASYWFAAPIAETESPGLDQFASDGTPVFGVPNGWGVMQIENPGNEQQKWNWQMNVQEGLSRLAERGETGHFHTTAKAS